MRYCVTMERTTRIAQWFEATSDEEAKIIAEKIHDDMKPSDYESGDEEQNYAICEETGRTVLDWN